MCSLSKLNLCGLVEWRLKLVNVVLIIYTDLSVFRFYFAYFELYLLFFFFFKDQQEHFCSIRTPAGIRTSGL